MHDLRWPNVAERTLGQTGGEADGRGGSVRIRHRLNVANSDRRPRSEREELRGLTAELGLGQGPAAVGTLAGDGSVAPAADGPTIDHLGLCQALTG
jgi:hypothetical protein